MYPALAAISSGESGAVGLDFIEEILSNPEYRSLKSPLTLDDDSVIFIFQTEEELENE